MMLTVATVGHAGAVRTEQVVLGTVGGRAGLTGRAPPHGLLPRTAAAAARLCDGGGGRAGALPVLVVSVAQVPPTVCWKTLDYIYALTFIRLTL